MFAGKNLAVSSVLSLVNGGQALIGIYCRNMRDKDKQRNLVVVMHKFMLDKSRRINTFPASSSNEPTIHRITKDRGTTFIGVSIQTHTRVG